jgi:uncharacterized protein (DUF2252 family)
LGAVDVTTTKVANKTKNNGKGPSKGGSNKVSNKGAKKVYHPSFEERRAKGKDARKQTPTDSSEGWTPAADRPDPVALLEEQDASRDADLVPVRHGRMMVSPFTFYRGAAKIMAADLKDTPTAGLDVQLCGDAHLSNFGVFGSPERLLLFDLNDFDETLPGPFEYDVKRMAASFTIAARNSGFKKADSRLVTRATVTAYRQAMAGFANMGLMETWYSRLDEDQLLGGIRSSGVAVNKAEKRALKTAEQNLAKARTRDSLQALSKLCEVVDGQYRIVSQPPVLVPARDIAATYGIKDDVEALMREELRAYRETLRDDVRELLERFEYVDAARKVVGVGSVGTRAFIILLRGRTEGDPLFLQIKEATSSVLEDNLPKSRYPNHGQRVVHGQRRMQAASDIFLGWTVGIDPNRHFYWRQLRDMKGSAEVELMIPTGMRVYADICGWTLARAHARSGDPIAISAYLGVSDQFDQSIVTFAERYADQNELDCRPFIDAIQSGRTEAVEGV